MIEAIDYRNETCFWVTVEDETLDGNCPERVRSRFPWLSRTCQLLGERLTIRTC